MITTWGRKGEAIRAIGFSSVVSNMLRAEATRLRQFSLLLRRPSCSASQSVMNLLDEMGGPGVQSACPCCTGARRYVPDYPDKVIWVFDLVALQTD